MPLTIEGVSVTNIGELFTDAGFGWVKLSVDLHDPEVGASHSVSISVALRYQTDWTVDQIREAAAEKAHDAFIATAAHLGGHVPG